MENDLLERVSERLEARRKELIAQPLSRIWPQLAQAAIDTIRAEIAEPSEAMIKSGAREVDWYDHNAIDCWRSMLAASPLGEKKDG